MPAKTTAQTTEKKLTWKDIAPLFVQPKEDAPSLRCGFEAHVLTDGRIYVPEWVFDDDEIEAGMQHVHDDEGREYIRNGSTALGTVYKDAKTFVRLAEDTLVERFKEDVVEHARDIQTWRRIKATPDEEE